METGISTQYPTTSSSGASVIEPLASVMNPAMIVASPTPITMKFFLPSAIWALSFSFFGLGCGWPACFCFGGFCFMC